MKNLTLCLISFLFTFTFASESFSQNVTSNSDWKLKSIALTTGETPLSSGLNFDVNLSNGKNSLYLSYNSVLGQVVYEISLTKWFSVYPTGGVYHNIPWAGPMFTFSMFKGKLMTYHWFGWSAGIPEEAKTSLKNSIFIFSFQEIKYTLGKTSFDYVLMHYEKQSPMHLMGLARRFQLSESKAISSSFTYVLQKKENLLTERIMWSLGFVWSFNN